MGPSLVVFDSALSSKVYRAHHIYSHALWLTLKESPAKVRGSCSDAVTWKGLGFQAKTPQGAHEGHRWSSEQDSAEGGSRGCDTVAGLLSAC